MTIIQERLEALNTGHVALDSGPHSYFEDGHCAMEVVAWLAGLGHTDAPSCASPVLREFTISLNDSWDTVQRQKLVPFLPRMVGTNGDGQDEARSYLALDWMIRTYTPAWLDLAGLTEEAQELRGLRRIVDLVTARQAGPVVRVARERAVAAGVAAGVAAWDAAGAVAWAAAWDAAGAAPEEAAWDAVGAAAWAGGVAALAASEDAARSAARARDVLRPTVTALQVSALDLLDRMISPEGTVTP